MHVCTHARAHTNTHTHDKHLAILIGMLAPRVFRSQAPMTVDMVEVRV